jgi:hypothetical protein
MTMAWGEAEEQRFRLLWKTRRTLDREGVAELWRLALVPLGRACARSHIKSLIDALPMDAADYVSEFFFARVYQSPGDDELEHSNALSTYFYRFLVSLRRKEHVGSVGGSGGESGNPDAAPAPEPETSLDEALGTEPCHELDPATLLADSLADPARVAESAAAFLRQAPKWARLYLRLHDCADKGDRGRMTRQAIAQRFGISSYPNKAYDLGVALPGRWIDEGRVCERYATTLIGRWIGGELGIPIEYDNAPLILACFKILCQAALTQVDEQGEMP